MVYRFYFVVFGLLYVASTFAQSFVRPESVEYDQAHERYLVSNKGNNTASGFILATNMEGTVTGYFVSPGITYPNALEIVGDTIFAATEEPSIKGYLLSNGQEVVSWTLDSPEKFNGLAYDGNKYLFASAPKEKYIYRIDVATGAYTRWQSASNINGLGYDKAYNRVLVCGWGNPAKIQALDPASGALTTVYTGKKDVFRNIDGIVADACGNYYASGWTDGKLYYFKDGFANDPEIIATGKQGPADIGINHTDRIVMLPKMHANALELFDISSYCPKVSDIGQATFDEDFQIFPNPASEKLHWRSEQEFSSVRFFSSDGSLLLSKPISAGCRSADISSLPEGIIICRFETVQKSQVSRYFIHRP